MAILVIYIIAYLSVPYGKGKKKRIAYLSIDINNYKTVYIDKKKKTTFFMWVRGREGY